MLVFHLKIFFQMSTVTARAGAGAGAKARTRVNLQPVSILASQNLIKIMSLTMAMNSSSLLARQSLNVTCCYRLL